MSEPGTTEEAAQPHELLSLQAANGRRQQPRAPHLGRRGPMALALLCSSDRRPARYLGEHVLVRLGFPSDTRLCSRRSCAGTGGSTAHGREARPSARPAAPAARMSPVPRRFPAPRPATRRCRMLEAAQTPSNCTSPDARAVDASEVSSLRGPSAASARRCCSSSTSGGGPAGSSSQLQLIWH